jgi:hypothetical protein
MIQTKLHRLFYGGTASDRKVGMPYSHGYSRALDFRKHPGRVSVLPGGRDIGSGVLVDLIQNIIQVDNGDRYAVGDQGNFYRISTSDVLTPRGKLDSGAAGLLYRKDMDELYISSTRTVSRYGKFTTGGAPTLDLNKYAQSRSEDAKAYRAGGIATFSLSSTLDETAKLTFEPDIEPLYSVKVKINTAGTGDWTLTLHDDANNNLGTVAVATADVVAAGAGNLIEFVFSTPVRMLVKPNARTYHVHVTSSDSTGSVFVGTVNDFGTADFEIWADRLIQSNNGLHPIEKFLQYTCVGNERYLSVWEPLSESPSNEEWLRHKLVFPAGNEVCGLAANDEFLCIATEERGTNSSRSFQRGKLFFWDGLSATYENYIDITEGAPQSVYTYNNMIYAIVSGALYCWPGGKNLIKLRTIADTDSEYSDTTDTTFNYPNMMAVRRNTLLVGYPSSSTNQSLEYGVYSWGQRDKNFPMSFGLNYSISTQTRFNTGGNLKIGCVRSFGDSLYIAWRDGNDYGLDLVDNSSDPAPSGSWESMEFESGDATTDNQAVAVVATFGAGIPSGYTITPKYRVDWATTWTYGDPLTTTNEYRMDMTTRFKMIEYGLDFAQSGATQPLDTTCVKFVYDDLKSEREW